MDFYVLLDETGGAAGPIPFDRVIRFTSTDLEAADLAMRSPVGGVLWWNPDYRLRLLCTPSRLWAESLC